MMVSKAKMQKVSRRCNQMCRLCLNKECLEDIFKAEGLHLWISDFLSIKITTEDRVSLAICSKCRLRLTEFNEFRTRCQEVQDVLKLMAKKKDKTATGKPVKLSVKAGSPDKSRDGSRKNATIRCQTCARKFQNKTLLREHKWRDHAQTPHVCPTCGKGFARRDRLQIHKETHAPSDQTTKIDPPKANQLQCQVCLKIFKTQKQLYDHKRVHGPRIYECSFCEKSFAVRQQWQKHLPTHANQARKNQEKISFKGSPQKADGVPCVQTEADTTMNMDVEDSELIKEDLNETQLTAKQRQMIFEDESITIEEVKIEFGPDTDTEVSYDVENIDAEQAATIVTAAQPDQPIEGTDTVEYCLATLKCFPCSKTFKNKRKFWDHIRLIHGPKNYLCTVCEKAFALPGDRYRHMRMHEKDTRTHRSKVTQQSNDSTNSEDTVLSQMGDDANRVQASGQDAKRNDNSLQCEECNETCSSKRQLWVHKKIHNADIHNCSECRETFSTRIHLQKHMTNHKSIPKLLYCSECNCRFASGTELEDHLRWHKSQKGQSKKPSSSGSIFEPALEEFTADDLKHLQHKEGVDKIAKTSEDGKDIEENVKIELRAEDDSNEDEDYDSDEEISIIVPRHMITNALDTVEENEQTYDQTDRLKSTKTVGETALAKPQTSEAYVLMCDLCQKMCRGKKQLADHRRIVHGSKK